MMKTSKRILATIVAVMLVATSLTVPTFASFTDLAEDASSYTAVNVLSNLGVINGYDDGNGNFSFKPENNVTRAEFTAMLLRTRGMGSIGSTSLENPPFPDVTTSDVSWAIANIRTAREMGIINGYDDGTFKPNNNVSYEEAIKMIVCALGYGEMGAEGAFWYSKYLQTATSLRFTDGAGGAIGTPATRATIASMLYNCLEVNLAENNEITTKTILENDLGLTKNVGYISANPEISLTVADSNLRDGEVQITSTNASGVTETATYKVEDTSKYNDMLGAQITFYYTIDKSSNFKHLLLATVKNSETIEIPASKIYSSTSTSIEYLKNVDDDKTITASINPDAAVVYNGKLYDISNRYSAFEMAKGMPKIGSVKLLDRDGDKRYDVVFVDSYETWVVSSVTSSDMTIVDNVLRSNAKLVLDPDKTAGTVKFVDKKGNTTTFSSIKKGSVVSVKIDSYGNIVAVVTNDSVSGKITAADSKNGMTINGNTYKLSKQAVWTTSMPAPAYGDSGKYYLDIDGNIIAYDKTEVTVTQYYGYMTVAKLDSVDGFTQELKVAISTKSDTKAQKTYVVTTKSKINGSPVTDLEAAEITLQRNYGGVKYTISKNNEIDDICTGDTPQTTGMEIVPDELYLYNKEGVDKNTDWTYNSASKELTTKAGGSTVVARVRLSGATILHVPTEGSATKNKILSTSDLKNGATYNIEAFDVTTTDTAKFVIVYGTLPEVSVSTSMEVMAVKSITETLDQEGNKKRVLTGYVNGGKDEVDRTLSSSDTDTVSTTVNVGDVVRLGKDDDEYTVKPANVIFSITTSHPGTGYPKEETNNNGTVAYKIIWGSVHAYDDETLVMAPRILSVDEVPGISEEISIAKSGFSSAKILEIDTTTTDPEKVVVDRTDDGYENILETLTYTGSGLKQSEIFLHMNSITNVKTMLIIKR